MKFTSCTITIGFSLAYNITYPYGLTNKNAKKIYAKSLRKYLFNLDCTCTNLTCDNCKNENYNVNHLIPEHYKIKDKKNEIVIKPFNE